MRYENTGKEEKLFKPNEKTPLFQNFIDFNTLSQQNFTRFDVHSKCGGVGEVYCMYDGAKQIRLKTYFSQVKCLHRNLIQSLLNTTINFRFL